ncbi:hypothetical protein JC825_14640 [Morganella morganii]|nr:hypothetical protein JC825_14640 [Morganella morganii]
MYLLFKVFMKKVICYAAFVSAALFLSGCAATKNPPPFSEKSIEECGRYLPDGIAYYVRIEGEVDLNKQFNGDINVTALQDSAPSVAFNHDMIKTGADKYMDCAIQLLNNGKGDTRTPEEKTAAEKQ